MNEKATMHCQDEIERDCSYPDFISDDLIFKWSKDGYSTSRHLLNLYALAKGLCSEKIVEIGFGRSSFVLARAAHETGGHFFACDSRDFSYLLSPAEKKVTTYLNDESAIVWQKVEGIDFAFLDYFSDERIPAKFCVNEINRCLSRMKTNGIIAVHDAMVKEYPLSSAVVEIAKNPNVEVITLPYCFGLTFIKNTGKSLYGKITDNFLRKDDIA